jgi:energy-coupling factor transport system permease protein
MMQRVPFSARVPLLVAASPLRAADPRTKLALGLAVSCLVMLPWQQLAVVLAVYAAFLLWAHLLPQAARQAWRLKWLLLVLFALDWCLVGIDLAVSVSLRLLLLAGAFTLLVATTTPGELLLALEWLRLPYRYAFSIGLAFQSVGLLDDEWRSIREAQQARGAWSPPRGWRELFSRARDLVALAVPAVVLATQRAWAVTEAAYARGFDSPHRRPYRQLSLVPLDWLLLLAAAGLVVVSLVWR